MYDDLGQDIVATDPTSGLMVLDTGAVISSDSTVYGPDGTIYNTDGTVIPPPITVALPSTYQQPETSSFSWLTNLIGPVTSGIATVIKAAASRNLPSQTGVPAGYYRNASGQLVPLSGTTSVMPTWLLPVGIGVAAFFFLKKK